MEIQYIEEISCEKYHFEIGKFLIKEFKQYIYNLTKNTILPIFLILKFPQEYLSKSK